MADISSVNGEIFKKDGTEIKSASGKTYKFSGLDAEDIAYDNTASGLEATNIQEVIDKIAELIPGKIEGWRQVRDVVRRGLASAYFSIGDRFEVKKGQSTILFDLIGIDEDVPVTSTATVCAGSSITGVTADFFTFLKKMSFAGDFDFSYKNGAWRDKFDNTVNLSQYGIFPEGTAADGDTIKVSVPHTITLKLHDTSNTESIIFDNPEAAWYLDESDFPNGLAAGTYHFTADGVTYQFTLSGAVPVGGSIRYNPSERKIMTFPVVGQKAADETVTVSEGDGGLELPSIPEIAINANTNGLKQIRYGLNDWKQSSIRQWLNARGGANSWWEPQNVFDRPANAEKAGFLNNLDLEFLNAVGAVWKKTKRNTALGGNIEINREHFFLLSHSEVYGGTGICDEGEPYSFFGEGSSDLPRPGTGNSTNRIVKSGNAAKLYWLRTINPSERTIYISAVNTTGGITAYTALSPRAAVPACVVY